jgi:hypothetical protein
MKINESRIRSIIKEEARRILSESDDFDGNTGMPSSLNGVATKMRQFLNAAAGSAGAADKKLIGFILKAIDPYDLKSRSFLQLVLNEVNFEAVQGEERKGQQARDQEAAAAAGQRFQADLSRRKIKSFDPDTGKAIYAESRLQEMRGPRPAQQVFKEIMSICDEALTNKSLGIKPSVADSYAKDVRRKLDELIGSQNIGDDTSWDPDKHGYGSFRPKG